jgi:hypothetical protein
MSEAIHRTFEEPLRTRRLLVWLAPLVASADLDRARVGGGRWSEAAARVVSVGLIDEPGVGELVVERVSFPSTVPNGRHSIPGFQLPDRGPSPHRTRLSAREFGACGPGVGQCPTHAPPECVR